MKKTSRILTVLALAVSSILFATPSQAVPTVNIAIDCVANVGAKYDQPVAGGWVVVATFTNCTTITPNWPQGTTWELKNGATTVASTVAGVQGSSATGLMATTPTWSGLSASSTYVLTVTLPDPLPAAFVSDRMNSKSSSGSKSGIAGSAGVSSAVHYFTNDPSYVPSGGSGAPAPLPPVDCTKEKAIINSVTFKDDGTGTAGFLTWEGTGIDSILYNGPATTYPKAFNYGAFTSSWNGLLSNLNPDTKYEFDLGVATKGGCISMKSVTFKTGAAPAVAAPKDVAYWTKFVDTYVIYAWEAVNMKNLMSKFYALETSPYRSFIKVPTSRVSTWSAISLTPKSCRAETNGVITALNGDTCSVSYTVSGASKAPVTLVRDFTFTKFSV
jgi:hypothetical protein